MRQRYRECCNLRRDWISSVQNRGGCPQSAEEYRGSDVRTHGMFLCELPGELLSGIPQKITESIMAVSATLCLTIVVLVDIIETIGRYYRNTLYKIYHSFSYSPPPNE